MVPIPQGGIGNAPSPVQEAILIYSGSLITEETPKIASSGYLRVSVYGGRNSIFARGWMLPRQPCGSSLFGFGSAELGEVLQ